MEVWGVGVRRAFILRSEIIYAPTISRAGLESQAKVERYLRYPSPFTAQPLRHVCRAAAAPAAVGRVISVTSLAKQKLLPYKYGNLMIELSISWNKLKALC